MRDSWNAVFFVFDADAPPDVWLLSSKVELRIEKLAQAIGALCEDLIGVPVGLGHYGGDGNDVIVRNEIVEEIAHGIHKNHLGLTPAQGFGELFGDEARVEALFVGMTLHTSEPFGKSLGVAMFAARADFCAASDGIPGRVGPLDL
jgi:hypothetical protein